MISICVTLKLHALFIKAYSKNESVFLVARGIGLIADGLYFVGPVIESVLHLHLDRRSRFDPVLCDVALEAS